MFSYNKCFHLVPNFIILIEGKISVSSFETFPSGSITKFFHDHEIFSRSRKFFTITKVFHDLFLILLLSHLFIFLSFSFLLFFLFLKLMKIVSSFSLLCSPLSASQQLLCSRKHTGNQTCERNTTMREREPKASFSLSLSLSLFLPSLPFVSLSHFPFLLFLFPQTFSLSSFALSLKGK